MTTPGQAVLVLGSGADVAWAEALPARAEAAGIAGQRLEITTDVSFVDAALDDGWVQVLALCDPAVISGSDLERLVERAGRTPTLRRVLVPDPSGDPAETAALAHRLGLVELRFGRPVGWVVRVGEASSTEVVEHLWLRSIYQPTVLDPAELPIHPEAEALHWAEVRRHGAARPPRD